HLTTNPYYAVDDPRHVYDVTEIRLNQHVTMKGVAGYAYRKRSKRQDVLSAPRRVADDVLVVHEPIVLLRVQPAVGRRARRRHRLEICPPCPTPVAHRVRNVLHVDDAARALGGEEGVATRERHVVRQAGMRDRGGMRAKRVV